MKIEPQAANSIRIMQEDGRVYLDVYTHVVGGNAFEILVRKKKYVDEKGREVPTTRDNVDCRITVTREGQVKVSRCR